MPTLAALHLGCEHVNHILAWLVWIAQEHHAPDRVAPGRCPLSLAAIGESMFHRSGIAEESPFLFGFVVLVMDVLGEFAGAAGAKEELSFRGACPISACRAGDHFHS